MMQSRDEVVVELKNFPTLEGDEPGPFEYYLIYTPNNGARVVRGKQGAKSFNEIFRLEPMGNGEYGWTVLMRHDVEDPQVLKRLNAGWKKVTEALSSGS